MRRTLADYQSASERAHARAEAGKGSWEAFAKAEDAYADAIDRELARHAREVERAELDAERAERAVQRAHDRELRTAARQAHEIEARERAADRASERATKAARMAVRRQEEAESATERARNARGRKADAADRAADRAQLRAALAKDRAAELAEAAKAERKAAKRIRQEAAPPRSPIMVPSKDGAIEKYRIHLIARLIKGEISEEKAVAALEKYAKSARSKAKPKKRRKRRRVKPDAKKKPSPIKKSPDGLFSGKSPGQFTRGPFAVESIYAKFQHWNTRNQEHLSMDLTVTDKAGNQVLIPASIAVRGQTEMLDIIDRAQADGIIGEWVQISATKVEALTKE